MLSPTRLNTSKQNNLSIDFAKINPGAWLFWIIFLLSCLMTRILDIALLGLFRTGAVVLISSALFIIYRHKIVNRPLVFLALVFSGFIALSASANTRPLLQFIAFVRIPLTAYLIYFVVHSYLINSSRVRKVFRLMYIVGFLQLPVLVIQRLSYPVLPDRLIAAVGGGLLTENDFSTGTFQGDGAMTFFLLTLLILLLFWGQVNSIVKRKWWLAFWFSLTVLVANSQIQYITLVFIWITFLVVRFNPKVTFGVIVVFLIVFSVLGWLFQTGILTFSPVDYTIERIETEIDSIRSPVARQREIDRFLAGKHARVGAVYYFLGQPLKWIGDGPGVYYNTVTRKRTLGVWGHVYTFYAEVGLIGLTLSMLFFLIVAFPLVINASGIKLRIGLVPLMIFIAMVILTFAKYPMNNTPMIFTYCVVLIGYQRLSSPKYLSLALNQRREQT